MESLTFNPALALAPAPVVPVLDDDEDVDDPLPAKLSPFAELINVA